MIILPTFIGVASSGGGVFLPANWLAFNGQPIFFNGQPIIYTPS